MTGPTMAPEDWPVFYCRGLRVRPPARPVAVIDPNMRVAGNQTVVAGADLSRPVGVGTRVRALEVESGLTGDAVVTRIDPGKDLYYLAVNWASLHVPARPGPVRRVVDRVAAAWPYRHTCTLRTLDGDRLDAKTRVGWWLALNWETWAARHRRFPWFPDPVRRLVCRAWGGHRVLDDQDDDPASRYCGWCGQPTPHADLHDQPRPTPPRPATGRPDPKKDSR